MVVSCFLMRQKKEELMDDVEMTSLGASHYPPACTHIPPFVSGRTMEASNLAIAGEDLLHALARSR